MACRLVHLLAYAQRDDYFVERLYVELVAPHRRRVAAAMAAAVSRGEVTRDPGDEVVDLVCDLVEGPSLARVALRGWDASDGKLAARTVAVALGAPGISTSPHVP